MKITRRGFEFTVEESRTVISSQLGTDTRWCARCKHRVQMVSPEIAARSVQITSREVYRLIDNDRIHFTETQAGDVLVCIDSLSRKE